MLGLNDLISIPYTPDLTQAGIVYACRSLAHTYDRMGGDLSSRLRRIVSGKAVELAFRRYLDTENVPYDNLGATPFTDPDRYDVAVGGRRCDIKSFLIYQKERIRQLRRNPAELLQAMALVPQDQLASSHLNDGDLFIFAFVNALITSRPEELESALAAGQPVYFMMPFPEAWARPATWKSLGPLVLKYETSEQVRLELGGQKGDRAFQTEHILLSAGKRTLAQTDFYSLAYVHVLQPPTGRLEVYSPRLERTQVIQPEQWKNIWVYGMQVTLAGYMTVGEFRRRAQYLPPGSQVWQYPRTRTANMGLKIKDLHPLADLLSRVRNWAGANR